MRSGLLAEFDSPESLVAAATKLHAHGVRDVDAFTPFPIDALALVLPLRRSRVPFAIGLAAMLGAVSAYAFQWWTAAVDYPIDSGGRPLHAGPAFVPIVFEAAVLFAGITAFIGLLVVTGLPRLWHPLDEVAGFERAGIDRFFLGIDIHDSRFVRDELTTLLGDSGALRVVGFGEVPP